jgi:hypothetical protein
VAPSPAAPGPVPRALRGLAHVACAGIAALCLGPGEIRVWVDERGVTHATNAPGDAPAAARVAGAAGALWGEERFGPPLVPERGASSSEDDRAYRALREALVDLQRGDTSLAVARLHEVLRLDASRPEAHFYLALVEARRGHLEAAEAHLRAFLSVAGDGYDAWRASALRRLAQLDDERALLASQSSGELRLVPLRHPDFTIEADAALLEVGGAEFSATISRLLEDTRAHVGSALGGAPAEPIGVVLYGRANYRRAHGHRFSFQTVGFFDGRIHAVSAAHPGGELRGLLAHEYTHALFKRLAGEDQPYWLNEGLAELLERSALSRPPLSRGEETKLRAAIATGEWLPLRRIAPSFSGLTDAQARLAYAISTAAADWLVRHTRAAQRAELLRSLGSGVELDAALRVAAGVDTEALDAALRRELLAGRALPQASAGPGQ